MRIQGWFIIAAIACGLMNSGIVRADDAEEAAVRFIEGKGGRVWRDETLPQRPVIKAALTQNPHLTDADLIELTPLKRLQVLWLTDTGVTGVGLAALAELKELERLVLSGCPINDAGLKSLRALKQLRWLELDRTNTTDAGLPEVANLRQLRLLSLSHTKVTDNGLLELTGLEELESLGLEGTAISDDSACTIAGFAKLRNLYVKGTNLSDAARGQLQEALPDCEISPAFAVVPVPDTQRIARPIDWERVREIEGLVARSQWLDQQKQMLDHAQRSNLPLQINPPRDFPQRRSFANAYPGIALLCIIGGLLWAVFSGASKRRG